MVAITHKGVIKATLGLACGWNLTGKSPVRLDWSCVHRFRFDPESGEFVLVEANLRLERTGNSRPWLPPAHAARELRTLGRIERDGQPRMSAAAPVSSVMVRVRNLPGCAAIGAVPAPSIVPVSCR